MWLSRGRVAGGEYSNGSGPGSKHFDLWPLSKAAEACFGTAQWPADRVVPQP
ncbi:hypothetical protein ABT317_04790 [Streptomyces carpinensis]|uniref:Uncharacterized protein n=1 Tax=Streptomyces carpinensis TaxID=66369 RepID=A0ABV1VWQ4_9ACTN